MSGLTKAQWDGLAYIASVGVRGPAPGWNASVMIENGGKEICDGADLSVLFDRELIEAVPAPPPHPEDFHEEAGSITCDHTYRITDAGRQALSGAKP